MSDEVDSALASAFRGASLFAVGRIASYLIGFFLNLILTNGLGAAAYGVFTYADTIMMSLLNFTDLGTDKGLVRFLPDSEVERDEREHLIGLAGFAVTVAGFGSAVLVYLAAPTIARFTLDDPSFVFVLRAFAFVLPFRSLTKVVQTTFRALEIPTYQLGISELLVPGSRFAGAAVAIGFGYAVEGVAMAMLVATVLLFLIAIGLLFRETNLRPRIYTKGDKSREFYGYSLPLTLNDAGTFLVNNVDILMIGFFALGSASVGYYRVAAVLSALISLPLHGLSQMFPPRAARLYSADKIGELDSLYSVVTRWTLSATLPLAIGLYVYRVPALSIFGRDFVVAQGVLAILVLRRLFDAMAGPSGYVLMMTDKQRLAMLNNIAMGISNVILNIIFIAEFGIIGAALATFLSVSVINVIQIFEAWWLEGLFPYSGSFYKPILAGVVCLISMELLKEWLPLLLGAGNFTVMLLGGSLGVIVYGALLGLLGLEDTDRRMVRNFSGKLR